MTKKQEMVLEFIRQYLLVHGFPPSYDDIAKGLQLRSRGNIHRMIHRLRKDGHLSLKAKKFRSLQLVDRSVAQVSDL